MLPKAHLTSDSRMSGSRWVITPSWLSGSLSQTCNKKRSWSVWWSAAGMTHYSFLNPSKTITSETYAQQINKMHRKLQCMQLALVSRKCPILLQDNVQPHITQQMLQKLNELDYECFPHLPYSPDLLPTDGHFLKHLNNMLQGKHFHNQQDAKNTFQAFIHFMLWE